MQYIAIIAVLLLGGGFLYQQSSTPSAPAETAVLALEEAESVIDAAVDTVADATDTLNEVEVAATDVEAESAISDELENNAMQAVLVGGNYQTMLVAGGCFWCVEADLEKLPGVVTAVSGYAGGTSANPTYGDYSKNGHREVVEVTYDPSLISFEEIIISVLKHTDPTDDDGSFGDRGDYYSAAFYYESDAQKQIIENLIVEIDEHGPYDQPLAIDIEARPAFWAAEDFHQDYYKGTLSKFKYKGYRLASGRDVFIAKYWGTDTGPTLPWRTGESNDTGTFSNAAWSEFVTPADEVLQETLTAIQYKITQKNGTERAFSNEYHDNKAEGIYVDIVSGEPLFSSTHKFDSGTGWPSFTRPIEYDFVTEHKDFKLIIPRTEIRSAIGDSHLGHVFNDAPKELGGIRYCMNSAALRFVAKADMEAQGYSDFLRLFE